MPDDPRTMDQDALTGAMMDAGDWLDDANPDLAQACYWIADLLGTLDPSEFSAAKRRILAAEADEAAQETGDAATGGPQ